MCRYSSLININPSGLSNRNKSYKTGVNSDPLGQTRSPVVNIVFAWNLFGFENWGRTDGRHVQKQWSLPAVNVSRPRGSIERS